MSDSPPIRILTVDDHPLFRIGVAALLATQPDMQLVAECADGREAVRQFRTHRPDVTLMDLQMPEMNGLDLILELTQAFLNVKVIAMSGADDLDSALSRARLLGARQTLQKLFNMDSLLRIVEYELAH